MLKLWFMKSDNALSQFAFLIGEWEAEISNASFLSNRNAKMKGPTSFAWVEGGAFLWSAKQTRTAKSKEFG